MEIRRSIRLLLRRRARLCANSWFLIGNSPKYSGECHCIVTIKSVSTDYEQRLTDIVVDTFRSSQIRSCIANEPQYRESLDLFTFPEHKVLQGEHQWRIQSRVARFRLHRKWSDILQSPPRMDPFAVAIRLAMRPPLSNRLRTRLQYHLLCIAVTNTELTESRVVVHSSTLLRYATSQDLKFMHGTSGAHARVFGLKYKATSIFWTKQWAKKGNEIWDFKPISR